MLFLVNLRNPGLQTCASRYLRSQAGIQSFACSFSRPAVSFPRARSLPAVGSSRGGSGAKPSSTSSAVAAKQAQAPKVGAGRTSASRAADGAAGAVAEGANAGGTEKAAPTQAKKATSNRKKAATLAGGGVGGEPHVYAESLEFLSSPPKKALKGVGPKRAEQMAKLGTYPSGVVVERCGVISDFFCRSSRFWSRMLGCMFVFMYVCFQPLLSCSGLVFCLGIASRISAYYYVGTAGVVGRPK